MRRLLLLAVLVLLPGCRNFIADWSLASPLDIFDGIGQQINDSTYRATGESDRARSYRKQTEEDNTTEPWNK
jgi:hypothetical protein